MELIVKERLEVVLAALYLFALCGNVHTDAALLYLNAPSINKCKNEYDRQKSVEHYLYGVITRNPFISVENGIVFKSALNRAYGRADLEPVALGEPVNSSAGHKHISNKNDFKQKEQNSSENLSVIKISESEDKEGELNCPITLCEGSDYIQDLIFNRKTAILEES